ncbi:hypothetical protein H6P81_003152 [Aristolochia fimbriata]|uniref:Uncharacterized protein n=1 Tax=Aristolochia fimbriata TaxID=158543 RepID=A0AAV7FDG6_ARIFI|nr:hypothetical protein H6P81_003152 [Aristolochia fimbriata]
MRRSRGRRTGVRFPPSENLVLEWIRGYWRNGRMDICSSRENEVRFLVFTPRKKTKCERRPSSSLRDRFPTRVLPAITGKTQFQGRHLSIPTPESEKRQERSRRPKGSPKPTNKPGKDEDQRGGK